MGRLPFTELGEHTRITMNRVWILDAVEKGVDECQCTWMTFDHWMPFAHHRSGKKQIDDDSSVSNQSKSLCLRIDRLHLFDSHTIRRVTRHKRTLWSSWKTGRTATYESYVNLDRSSCRERNRFSFLPRSLAFNSNASFSEAAELTEDVFRERDENNRRSIVWVSTVSRPMATFLEHHTPLDSMSSHA